MNINCEKFFKIFCFLFWDANLLSASSIQEECDSNGINCISCSDYQKCNAGKPEGAVFSCKNGMVCDDVQLEQCRLKLSCFDLVECTQEGIFADTVVESDYYVCLGDPSVGFIKYEFTCPEGNYFDQASVSCVPAAATSTSTSTVTPTTTPTTTAPIPTEPPICTQAGTFPSPTNCKMYYRCSTSLTAFYYVCPGTSYFNENLLKCSMIVTPACQQQILINSTTTLAPPPPQPITTTSTTPSPLPSPTTLIPITTSKPSTFVCAGPGIFSNPTNCKMYYRCSTSLKVFNYICPGTSYFNENILKCSLIITPACQEQILKNSTATTPAPPPPTQLPTTTTTPPTTTTTTPPPTTTPTTPPPTTTPTSPPPTTTPTTPPPTTTPTTTPPTTTPTTPPPMTTTPTPLPTTTITGPPPTQANSFICSIAGTYPDLLNCKSYYRCSTSGAIFKFTCPGESYFNEFTKRCALLITPRCRKLI